MSENNSKEEIKIDNTPDEINSKALQQLSKSELKSLINNKENTKEIKELGILVTHISDSIQYIRDKKEEYFEVLCPHCHFQMQILPNQINCKIFRHGAFKKNGKQLPPHHPKEACLKLIKNNAIYGCGLPFTFNGKEVRKCGWI